MPGDQIDTGAARLPGARVGARPASARSRSVTGRAGPDRAATARMAGMVAYGPPRILARGRKFFHWNADPEDGANRKGSLHRQAGRGFEGTGRGGWVMDQTYAATARTSSSGMLDQPRIGIGFPVHVSWAGIPRLICSASHS